MPVKAQSLQIVLYPSPVLRRVAKPVDPITDEVRSVARRMIELMHEARGVGLAAPQIGLAWRLFVANPTGQPADDRVFINPVLRDPSQSVEPREEGCLSIPNVRAEIRRPDAVTVDALDLEGRPFTLTDRDLAARIWQHEIDHLNGVLIIDRMTAVDKLANRRHLKELEDNYNR